MKVFDLKDATLDYYVAMAEGAQCVDGKAVFSDGSYVCTKTTQRNYSPSMFWRDGGPLVDKYKMSLAEGAGTWFVGANAVFLTRGDTPLQAICRAVVRAAFGDEVGEVP